MDIFTGMTPIQAAALHTGLLVLLMLGLKIYVASARYKHKVLSGEAGNAEFGRAGRVQMNAVEDVPPLMVGLVALALLGMPAWYIHATGGLLLVARIAHAVGLAGSSGRSLGRAVGTFGTLIVALAVAGALIVHAFGPPPH